MEAIAEQVIQGLQQLPIDKQQEVLAFVQSLQSATTANNSAPTQPKASFLQAAKKYAGSIKDAPADLSTNPEYFEGFGES